MKTVSHSTCGIHGMLRYSHSTQHKTEASYGRGAISNKVDGMCRCIFFRLSVTANLNQLSSFSLKETDRLKQTALLDSLRSAAFLLSVVAIDVSCLSLLRRPPRSCHHQVFMHCCAVSLGWTPQINDGRGIRNHLIILHTAHLLCTLFPSYL